MPQYFRLAEHISLTNLDDEAVLLDLHTGAYFGLNHVGLTLIELLNSGQTQTEAVKSTAERFHAEEQLVAKDARSLIDEMLEHGLIEAV